MSEKQEVTQLTNDEPTQDLAENVEQKGYNLAEELKKEPSTEVYEQLAEKPEIKKKIGKPTAKK